MKKNKLNILDVKAAVYDQKFRALFPEFKEAFDRYLKDPGCACNMSFLKELMRKKDRMQQYFPTKECKTPEEEEADIKNDWVVINCPISELENRLKKIPQGKRIIAAARYKDRITAIINDIAAHFYVGSKTVEDEIKKESKANWKVINTTIHELIEELNKLPQGRKVMTLTRYEKEVTLLVNDMSVLF